jgi:Lhr-like helicase
MITYIGNTIKVLNEIEEGKIKIKEVHTQIPSPFASNIITRGGWIC